MNIAKCFWGVDDNSFPLYGLEPFFRYFSEQCCTVYHAFGGHIPLKSTDDIINLAFKIQGHKPRSEVRESVQRPVDSGASPVCDERSADGAIDLVVRLMTMLDIGCFPQTSFSGRDTMTWDNGSLKAFLAERFPISRQRDDSGVKLGTLLTVRNLDRIGGLNVQLTTNLADHLLYLPEQKDVLIFHHATFLTNQKL